MHRTSSDPESLVDEKIDDKDFLLNVSSVFQTCHNKTVPDSSFRMFGFGRPSHDRGDDMEWIQGL